jgi:spoIIIJ-associated protein
MTGFFKKLFGGGLANGKKQESQGATEGLIRLTMDGVIEKANFEMQYEITSSEGDKGEKMILVNVHGADQHLIEDNKGELLRAIQLLLQRVVQHNFPEERSKIDVDSNDYLKEASESLIEIVEDLKEKALKNGKSVYLRALPPKERKIVHQYLATDARVRGRSIGDGLYKKIKIYPVKNGGNQQQENEESAT